MSSIDIHKLTCEQRQQIFLALFDADQSLLNILSPEQRHKLHTSLITIDPSLAGSFPDARSAIHGVTNEQFPKGSAINPIKIQEYKEYKQTQKQINKEFQWHEFLKLDKKQYLNFRNDLRNRAALRLTRGESLSRQQKGKIEEIIKDFKEANLTFPISEADFIFREWLSFYCNSTVDQVKKKEIADAKKNGLPLPLPKKKNIRPPSRKRSMNDSIEDLQDNTGNTSAMISPSPIFKNNAPATTETILSPSSTVVLSSPIFDIDGSPPVATETMVKTSTSISKGKKVKGRGKAKEISSKLVIPRATRSSKKLKQ